MKEIIDTINSLDYIVAYLNINLDVNQDDIHAKNRKNDVIEGLKERKADLIAFLEKYHNIYTVKNYIDKKNGSLEDFYALRNYIENKNPKIIIHRSILTDITYDVFCLSSDMDKTLEMMG